MLAKLLFAVERKTYPVSVEHAQEHIIQAEEPGSVGSNAGVREEGLCKAKAGGKEGEGEGHRDSVLSNARTLRTSDSVIKGGREGASERARERAATFALQTPKSRLSWQLSGATFCGSWAWK